MKKSKMYIRILLVLSGIPMMYGCEKQCDVRLKNGTVAEIVIFTKSLDDKGREVEKSSTLKVGEQLAIGQCTDCATLEDNEVTPEKMLLKLGTDELELKSKQEILKFLGELRDGECGVKIFE